MTQTALEQKKLEAEINLINVEANRMLANEAASLAHTKREDEAHKQRMRHEEERHKLVMSKAPQASHGQKDSERGRVLLNQ